MTDEDLEPGLGFTLQPGQSRTFDVSWPLPSAEPDGAGETARLRLALARARAGNEAMVRHIAALIATTRAKGAPDAATLIAACEMLLRKACHAAGDATP